MTACRILHRALKNAGHRKRDKSNIIQDSYRQDCVKFKNFSRTSKRLSAVIKDGKLKKNADLQFN